MADKAVKFIPVKPFFCIHRMDASDYFAWRPLYSPEDEDFLLPETDFAEWAPFVPACSSATLNSGWAEAFDEAPSKAADTSSRLFALTFFTD